MTDWNYDDYDPCYEDRPSLPRKIFSRTLPVLATMTFSALVALRVAGGLAGNLLHEAPRPQTAAITPPALAKMGTRVVAVAPLAVARPATQPYGALLAPEGLTIGAPTLADVRPLGPGFSPFQAEAMLPPGETEQATAENEPEEAPAQQLAENIPMPPPRPALEDEALSHLSAPLPPARPAELSRPRVADAAPRRENARPPRNGETSTMAQNDPRSFFDKLFGSNEAKGPQLAYASPEGGGALHVSRGVTAAAKPADAQGGTAIYDISSHTVFLPSGEKLEAHSGLGAYFDDPDHVHLRMRGATPPATYSLTLRESLFHGVQALRLTPLDSNVHGRSGLLAHTFMLGQRGDSNGCVSFRNYRAFLAAYMRGEVRRLKVVASR
jgi:hypothetical protein